MRMAWVTDALWSVVNKTFIMEVPIPQWIAKSIIHVVDITYKNGVMIVKGTYK